MLVKNILDSICTSKKRCTSYAVEIQRAQNLGLDNVVEQLQKNLQIEIKKNKYPFGLALTERN